MKNLIGLKGDLLFAGSIQEREAEKQLKGDLLFGRLSKKGKQRNKGSKPQKSTVKWLSLGRRTI
jgi:hypothetical protein